MVLLAAITALAATGVPAKIDPPVLNREFRGVWVATVANIDWPSKPGLPTDQQQKELLAIMDKAAALNLNAIVLQVRPSADALYDSKIEPWSAYLTGQQGVPPNPYWDPLEFAVEAAHKRGLELHCWFNPYRALHPAQRGTLASRHISRLNPRIVKTYGPYLWLDPGEPATQQETLSVMTDVVKRYDIDGIHIDDYFYPYKEKGPNGQDLDFPDHDSFGRYKAAGGSLSKDDWRRKNVDDFVEALYKDVKHLKPWVKVGISPFGIYRPGVPAGIKAGVDQYADLYADPKKWLQEGWCDYLSPQLYWPVHQTAQAYPALLSYWMGVDDLGRHIWPGNFTSKEDPGDGHWPTSEILDQIDITRKDGADGNVHFSMQAFMKNYNGISTALRQGPYAHKALVPASPWLDSKAPQAPTVRVTPTDDGGYHIHWAAKDSDVRFFAAVPMSNGKWLEPVITSDGDMTIHAIAGPKAIAVFAIDRAGNQSQPTIETLKTEGSAEPRR